jgi:glyoxylase-like metal-dependent hydrolase (beta-lactamase superfamily II)
MKQIAADVFLLRGFPPDAYNVYAVRSGDGFVLVDTATRHARKRILKQLPKLPGRLEAIFVTHAHQDHAGSMHVVAVATGAPVWGPEGDADALEGKAPIPLPEAYRDNLVNRTFKGGWKEFHPVARRLNEGDRIGDFEAIAFPGHTPGQLGLWRESDRTMLCADTMRAMNFATGLPQLGEMPKMFTVDPAEARNSIRKLAALEPRTVCFGHGRPMSKDTALRIGEFAEGLLR